ncbi:MAG: hypothetical protein ACRDQB_14385 [Thermocrispum sp.]
MTTSPSPMSAGPTAVVAASEPTSSANTDDEQRRGGQPARRQVRGHRFPYSSEALGSQRFGTSYRYRDTDTGLLDGGVLPVDLAANAASLGAHVIKASSVAEFRDAVVRAKANTRATVVHVEVDLYGPNPPGSGWWDVPVSEVSDLDSTRKAYETYAAHKRAQRHYL